MGEREVLLAAIRTRLDAAVEAGRVAVEATPVGHLDRTEYLNDLGNALASRFARLGAAADLDDVVPRYEETVEATSDDDPGWALYTALGFRGPPQPCEGWPRVWWLAGGPLSLLPLHAAGYQTGPERCTVMDRVISSYTPTVRALPYARGHTEAAALYPSAEDRTLVVAMPTTPGISGRLGGVRRELALLRGRVPQPSEPPPIPEVPYDPARYATGSG